MVCLLDDPKVTLLTSKQEHTLRSGQEGLHSGRQMPAAEEEQDTIVFLFRRKAPI